MEPTCINLKQRFGRRFRVGYEESYRAAYGPGATREDPWLMILRCQHGHVFPQGGEFLAASVDGHPNVASVLRRLDCCRITQDGDGGELTVVFHVKDFAKVAAIIRPRRRRQVNLNSQEREAIGRRLRAARQDTRSALVEPNPEARSCDPKPLAGPEAVCGQRSLFDR